MVSDPAAAGLRNIAKRASEVLRMKDDQEKEVVFNVENMIIRHGNKHYKVVGVGDYKPVLPIYLLTMTHVVRLMNGHTIDVGNIKLSMVSEIHDIIDTIRDME